MGDDESLKVIEDVENALVAQDMNVFASLHSESVALYTPDSPEAIRGRAGLKEWYQGFVNGLPDLNVKTERLFAQGEWVCGEYSCLRHL